MPSPDTRRGIAAGLVAGLVLVALMYLLQAVVGLQPLSQLLQQPVLRVMPGPVFGLLIDRLQHAGKVVEEAGLILAMLAGLALLGGLHARLRRSVRIPYLSLAVGAAAWLLVMVVLLPISGDGFFGLKEGLTAPLLWGILFAVYSMVLQSVDERWLPPDEGGLDRGRRSFLLQIPTVLAGGALVVLGAQLLPGWYRAIFNPPESGLTGPSPELTPVGNFYVVSKNFVDPVVSASGWNLSVHGLVDKPFRLDLAALRAIPAVSEFVTLECISNVVGGQQISTAEFAGVPLQVLLQMAGVQAGASVVGFRSRDGYTESLPLDLVMRSPEILVAHSIGGAPIPDGHGFPARILVPGHYGMKGPKWLEDIEVRNSPRAGFWEGQGWNPDATVKTMARLDVPHQGQLLKVGPQSLAGVAFAGSRGISAVEFSSDGRTWSPATLSPALSSFTWRLWTASWTPAAAGAYELRVRARDGSGALQPAGLASSYPDGASGYHAIQVDVSGS